MSTLNISAVEPFRNVSSNIKPITTKSHRFSNDDNKFIYSEVGRLLKERIIDCSQSPWRAQVVVVKKKKKRLVIDYYSQTIKRFTLLDAFPLPNINELMNKIAQVRVFSTFDIKSAYHQLSLQIDDRIYIAFEACSRLYQFTRLPFAITNGVFSV